MLRVDSIDVYYGDVKALGNVSFSVGAGEVVALLGPNGAGKTTTLNAISGLLRPLQGKIYFEGRDMSRTPDHAMASLGIAHVPEGRRLFPDMTVLENLEMGSFVPEARAKRRDSLQMAFSLFPRLKERISQKAGTLSGGEAQMLAIARGIMTRPKLMLMDEPSLGLSPLLVSRLFEIIGQINREGITILLVEQNVVHALTHSSRAYIMETGTVVLQGASEAMLDNDHIKEAYLGV
ncbi:MAG: ABC transporter ATP-binding protein [Desulfobaccales bacterium]